MSNSATGLEGDIMLRAFKFMANLVIVGFVVGRAYNEWQHRHRIVAVRPRTREPVVIPPV